MSNLFRKYFKLKNTLKIISILLISCSMEVYGNNFKNLNISFNKENKIEKNELKIISNYIVDSGDILFINFSGIDVFSKEYQVDLEGYIFLPEIYKFNVRNKKVFILSLAPALFGANLFIAATDLDQFFIQMVIEI